MTADDIIERARQTRGREPERRLLQQLGEIHDNEKIALHKTQDARIEALRSRGGARYLDAIEKEQRTAELASRHGAEWRRLERRQWIEMCRLWVAFDRDLEAERMWPEWLDDDGRRQLVESVVGR